jgi:hypothetical protein
MANNFGIPYKGGLGGGSALKIGSNSTYSISYSSQTFYQEYCPRINGVNTTILANQPFVWTYKFLPEIISSTVGGNKNFIMYRGDDSNDKLHLCFQITSGGLTIIYLIAEERVSINDGIIMLGFGPRPREYELTANKGYNFMLYKNEGSFSSSTSYGLYINGKRQNITVARPIPNSPYTPTSTFSSITFNNIIFGGEPDILLDKYFNSGPMYVFNSSVFKLDSGLTTTYIDNLALELHKVDNYIELLPTSYTIAPNNVVYYFPFYLKEGRDVKDFYNPSKQLNTQISFGNDDIYLGQSSDFVDINSPNYQPNEPTQPASIYRGPYNVWRRPYPPYEPYI